MSWLVTELIGPLWGAMTPFLAVVLIMLMHLYSSVHRNWTPRYRPGIEDFVLLVHLQKALLNANPGKDVQSPQILAGPSARH